MAAVETEADEKFANVDVDSILSRVGRRPLTFNKTRFLYKIPEFVKRLTGEETVNEGTTVQLETKVTGIPRPTLRWFKDEEEIVDHPRIHVESTEDGVHVFTVENVNKGDEAAYRCRAENEEGTSSSMFYLHVKVKPKSPKRTSKHLTKRTVSYPPMFPTIVEKVEEEEKEAKETARSPPSPLTQLYDGLTLQTRHTWPKFLGDWAYVESAHRNGGSIGSETDSEPCDGHSLESIEHDEVFTEEGCEKSTQGDHASFYVSSDDVTPETPDSVLGDIEFDTDASSCSSDASPISNGVHSDEVIKSAHFINGNSTDINSASAVAQCGDVAQLELNNNEPKDPKGKRDMHLPLSVGLGGRDKGKAGDKGSAVSDKQVKKKEKKDPNVTKSEDKKKSGDKVKVPKKTDDKEKSDKLVKKTEKVSKKSDSKEKLVKKESAGVKKSDCKDDNKSTPKPKDSQKSPIEKKTVKKTDLKDKKTDSPKRKSESKEKKTKCDYISNPDPPILGTARPLVFTNLASKLVSYSCTDSQQDSLDSASVYTKSTEQYDIKKQCIDINGGLVSSQDSLDLAIVPPPLGDVPFGRYFEEFIFAVCLFTFLALCIGIPTETFVLVILGMHFAYSMATITGLC